MFKLCLTIVFLAGMQLHVSGQCTGNALWLNGENDGNMKDTALIGGSVMVYASTSGTMTNGRPLYRTTGSVWKGLYYGGLQVWRAYSSFGSNYTSFKLSAPLDSNFIHVRVDNIRGDFPNLESQNVRGYFQGSLVAASFKDPVNGAFNSGNTINGGSTTNSSTQSAMRVFFHSAVDSIVIQQTSLSDWIIAELMIECNYLLPVNKLSWVAEKNNDGVKMQWETSASRHVRHFQVERSSNGTKFNTIAQVDAGPMTTRYSANDRSPASGKNYYRLKTVYTDGHFDYSDIITINWTSPSATFAVFPNPATSAIHIRAAAHLTTLTIYSLDGKILMRGPVTREQQINVAHWPRGRYLIRAEWPGGYRTEKIILR
jgi:Secretion system C-terminal sorting domain